MEKGYYTYEIDFFADTFRVIRLNFDEMFKKVFKERRDRTKYTEKRIKEIMNEHGYRFDGDVQIIQFRKINEEDIPFPAQALPATPYAARLMRMHEVLSSK